MSAGKEGVEEQEIPPVVQIEMEVESEPGDPPAEIKRRNVGRARARNPRYNGPLLPRFPFKTATGYGNWIYSRLESTPQRFQYIHTQFMRYCVTGNIKNLVRSGKKVFRDYDRLCFLYGTFLVATSVRQKIYVRNKFAKEWGKMSDEARRGA